jgi:hypothetical protein
MGQDNTPPADAAARPAIDPKSLIEKSQRVLEFAWGTGVLDLNCAEYAELMKLLYPTIYGTNQKIERRISELRNRKANLFGLS